MEVDPNLEVQDDETAQDSIKDYNEIIAASAFIGNYPYNTIMESITEQFNDYINMDDKENYVDIFYTQLHQSYEATKDEREDHPSELVEVLDKIHNDFIAKMNKLFNMRLTISIQSIESEEIDYDELEFIIRRLYEFFILGACDNFRVTISTDINAKVKEILGDDMSDERKYFDTLNRLIDINYSPLIRTITPTEFLRYRGDKDIIDLFDEGKVSGNFLRKYSPKLYQNEEYRVEIINHATMVQQFKNEVLNNDGQ